MAGTSQLFLYTLVLLTSCLCLFNHFRYENLRNQINKKQGYTAENIRSRYRRGIVPNIEDHNDLRKFIQQETNASIQAEVAKVFEKMLLNFAKLCELLKKCDGQSEFEHPQNFTSKLMGPPGPPGPRGPRGPPGKNGKQGLGLFFPEIKEANLNVVANESNIKTLKCKIFGNPLPKVRWIHHFDETNIMSKTDRITSEITSFLTVKNISWSDRGKATCIGESILGSANASGVLTVQASPIISLPQGPMLANLGSNFTFPECVVVSEPKAKVTWKRGYGSFPENRVHVADGNLTIIKVRVEDEGFYVCTAENYLGKATKSVQLNSRQLSFLSKPPFFMQVTNNSATLTCSALGAGYHMKGTFYSLYQNKPMISKVIKKADSFTITTNVQASGVYKCVIEEGNRKIETSSNVKLFTLISSIVSQDQIVQIGKWLKEELVLGTYVLCWRHSGGNINSFSEFHSRCDNRKNVLAIFRYSSTKIFGGFSKAPWKAHGTSGSENSFLFSIKPSLFKITLTGNTPVCYSSSYGPCFGSQELYASSSGYRNIRYQSSGEGRKITPSSRGELSALEVFYKIDY